MSFKEQYLDALADFSEAVFIRRQMIDPKKEKKINELSKSAIVKLQEIVKSCKNIEDLEALAHELGLKFTKEQIHQAAEKDPNILLNAYMTELQQMLQEQIIPVEYKILDDVEITEQG